MIRVRQIDVGAGEHVCRLFLLSSIVAALLWPATGRAGENWTWGVAAGSPQTLAATLERKGDTPVRVQAHAGTIVVVSSLGIRLLVLSLRGTGPYAFLGGGMLHVAEGEGGGAVGSSGYGWGGAGLRFRTGAMTVFVELGVLWGMNEDNGYDSAVPGLALGVGFGEQRSRGR